MEELKRKEEVTNGMEDLKRQQQRTKCKSRNEEQKSRKERKEVTNGMEELK